MAFCIEARINLQHRYSFELAKVCGLMPWMLYGQVVYSDPPLFSIRARSKELTSL